MSKDSGNLAALIGSRICHDLISPIGAINNGLELLAMSDGAQGPEIELIGESVNNASARIRYFRVAFGAASDQMVSEPEINSILNDIYGTTRIDVTWLPSGPQPRTLVRRAFLALQCLETALPYGGQIQVIEQDGSWTLTGSADKLNIVPELWDILTKNAPTTDVQPAHVQFALLPKIAAEDGQEIRISLSDSNIKISI